MANREKSLLRFDALRVEGAIIQPDVVASAAKGAAEGQTPESYGIDRGLILRDEIGRAYSVAKGIWATYQEGIGGPNPGAVRLNLAVRMLTRVLGFKLEQQRCYPAKGGADIDLYRIADERLPVAIGTGVDIDHVESLEIVGADPIRRSATTLVQGELNSREGALWGIATNGLTWRLLRDNESITRPGYIDIDLGRIFRDDLYSDFTAFWLVAHRSRFPQEGAAGSDCSLERWRQIGREKGVTARTELRDGVQKALLHFGRGFLENPANAALVARLNVDGDARLTKEDLFRQLLRMVYRLIFVMTAEDRDILHPADAPDAAKAAYEGGYATGRLRERARNRIAWDRHHDAFEGMKALFRALRHGEPKLGLPALGGLFAPEQTPDLDGARLTNKRFLQGFHSLAWLRRDKALSRINWRDMETEEFGSVYESLLELTPDITDGGRKFSFVGRPDEDKAGVEAAGKNAKGNERKTTGSYYTPDSLVQLLLKEALDPVIDRKVAENLGDPEALLTLKVIDPACGSGHFILAAARKIARKLADLRHAGSPTVAQYRHALRDVARRCIYGVDRNPMAIELCRVAIWVETVEPGKPLTFMDQKIRCGDSLVGVYDFACLANGIPDEAYAPLAGDDKGAAAHYRKLNTKQREPKIGKQVSFDFIKPPAELVDEAREIDQMEEDDLEQIAQKRAKFEVWQATGWINQKRACDLWTAAFFVPKKDVPPSQGLYEVPLTDNVWTAWTGTLPPEPLQKSVDKAVKDGAFLHWPLVFADVMKGGGFDCVMGNPPYIRQEAIGDQIKHILQAEYDAFNGMADIYVYFYERALQILRNCGRLSFVVTNKWLKAGYAEGMREKLTRDGVLESVIDFGHAKQYFPDADVFPCIVVVSKPTAGTSPPDLTRICVVPKNAEDLTTSLSANGFVLPRSLFSGEMWALDKPSILELAEKIRRNGTALSEFTSTKPYRGVLTGFNDAFLVSSFDRDRMVRSDPSCASLLKPFLRGQDIERWNAPWNGEWMIFTRHGVDIDSFISVRAHLEKYRTSLEPKPPTWRPSPAAEKWSGRKEGNYAWFEIQDSVDYWREMEKPKIIYSDIAWSSAFAFEESGCYPNNSGYFIPTSDQWVLAVLNSPVGWWYSWRRAQRGKDDALRYFNTFVENYPIPTRPNIDIDAMTLTAAASTRELKSAKNVLFDALREHFEFKGTLERVIPRPFMLSSDDFVLNVRGAIKGQHKWTTAKTDKLIELYDNIIVGERGTFAALDNVEVAISIAVNRAYGLNDQDLELMWASAPPRMPAAQTIGVGRKLGEQSSAGKSEMRGIDAAVA